MGAHLQNDLRFIRKGIELKEFLEATALAVLLYNCNKALLNLEMFLFKFPILLEIAILKQINYMHSIGHMS